MTRSASHTCKKGSFDRILNRYWVLVMIVALAYNFGMVIMDNSVVLYGTSLGYSNAKSGLFATAFSVAAIIFRVLAGFLSDRMGRRFTMLIGCAVFAVSVYFFGIIPAFGVMLVMRFFNGAGFGLSSVAASAASTDVIPQEKLETASTLFYIPMALAYVLCGYIVLSFTSRNAYISLYYINTGILIAGIIAAILCVYEKNVHNDVPTGLKGSYKGIECFFEKSALPCTCVGLFVSIGVSLCTTFIMKYADDVNIVQAGLFFTIMGIVMLIFNITGGFFIYKLGRLPFLIIIFCFFGISLILLGSTGLIAFFYMLAVGLGVISGGCTPTLFSIAADNAPEGRRGTALSTFLISNDIGIAVGAVLWGRMIDVVGYSTAFIMDGFCIAIALFLSIVLLKKD